MLMFSTPVSMGGLGFGFVIFTDSANIFFTITFITSLFALKILVKTNRVLCVICVMVSVIVVFIL